MNNNFYHEPVMLNEVTKYLITENEGYYVDCTFGGGGHSIYFLKNFDNIKIIAFDQDADAYKHFMENKDINPYRDRVIFCRTNFSNLYSQLQELKINTVNGIFADLGVSSKQLDDKTRGFSFSSNDILDMRMDKTKDISAYDVVNSFSKEQLQDIFFKYGEESFAKQIAEEIDNYRVKGKIKTCNQLTDIVCKVKWKKGKINPATKVFQALRIYVNDELESLNKLIDSSAKVLDTYARVVILTYHSLEDRIVKQKFKELSNGTFTIVNKKVIIANETEIKNNPRSRSAKMRVLEKTND